MHVAPLVAAASLLAPPISALQREIGSIRWLEPREVSVSGTPVTLELGKITLPECRSAEKSRLIEVAFARLSIAGVEGPPLVYLHGGPGGSAIGAVRRPESLAIWRPFLDLGPVVLLDQRGCGESEPDFRLRPSAAMSPYVFADEGGMDDALLPAVEELAARLAEEGCDLSGYQTEESADDVDDLREALGAERMRLLGFSYGTHLGLSVIRRHGERVDSAVLVGVEGPDHTFKLPSAYDTHLRKLALLVAADENTREDVPDFAALTRKALERVAREPITVKVTDPVTGTPLTLEIGHSGLAYILVRDLGDTSDLSVLPRLVHEVSRGESTLLAWFAQKRLKELASLNAVFLLVDPASGASADRTARIAAEAKSAILGDAMNLAFPAVEEVLPAPLLSDAFRAPLVSDVPTLFVTGDLDSNTPPYQAAEVRWGFSRARTLELVNAGHEDWSGSAETIAAIRRFFAEGEPGVERIVLPAVRFAPVEGKARGFGHPALARGR